MSFDLDDPKLTAYALGELDEAERAEVEALVRQSPEVQRYVDEVRATARDLESHLRNELDAEPQPQTFTIPAAGRPRRWLALAVAASVVVAMGATALVLLRRNSAGPTIAQGVPANVASAPTTQPALERDRAVREKITQVKQLVREGKYEQALAGTDQILLLDPNNDYAQGARPLIEDRARFLEPRLDREDFDRELRRTV